MDNDKKRERKPPRVWIDRCKSDSIKNKRLLRKTYKKNQILIFFDAPPTDDERKILVESFRAQKIDTNKLNVRSCTSCDPSLPVKYVELWEATNIDSTVNVEGVRAGSTSSHTVGESYSLNFFNSLPFDREFKNGIKESVRTPLNTDGKENIIVAVLDTGIDTKLVPGDVLWKANPNDGQRCYEKAQYGWNFINNSPDITDDHANRHGSIISQFIVNEFVASQKNYPQLMVLKTHDKEGNGDLFGVICAIHFAIAKGAHIINASWGFYYYFQEPIPYLRELITSTLKKRGILFVTAAGNQIPEEDALARKIFFNNGMGHLTDEQLRSLDIHNFYPAQLSFSLNNVLTTTTTDGSIVSPRQNNSNQYVDLGVKADKNLAFKLPFPGSPPDAFVPGSSFATAIATGKIGAVCDKHFFAPGHLLKSNILNSLPIVPPTPPPTGLDNFITNGRFIERTP